MRPSSFKRFLAVAAAALASLPAQAGYGGLVVFGDSLSDSGNNFLAANPPPNPPTNITPASAITSNFFVPTFPYAPSASYPLGVYSNGPVWATSFATSLGLAALPSLVPGGSNFAFGGAQTSGGSVPSLIDQTNMFLGGTAGAAPGNYLYVVAGGGNNARAALTAIAKDPGNAPSIVTNTALGYASDIGQIVDALQTAGAKDIVVWNTPDLGLAPAVSGLGAPTAALATLLTDTMNDALAARLGLEVGVDIFDLFGLLGDIVAAPSAYGLSNAKDACELGQCPSSDYLFWDGIHPTAQGHQILAAAMQAQVPEPQTALLVALGLAVLAWRSRRRAS